MTDSSYPRTETAHHRPESPEALEREVNAERGRVAETLDALQEKMSVGNIVDDVVRSFSRYGGDMAGNLGRQVRSNPLPLILTGIGLAWLMTSSGRDRYRYREDDYLWDTDDDDIYDEDFVGTRRYGAAGAVRPYGTAGVAGPYGETHRDTGPGTGDRIRSATGSAASSVGGAASSAARGVGSAASSAASGIGSAASGAANAASSGARGAYYGARHAGESVREGAYRAGRGAYDAGLYSVRRLDDMIHDHPLAMGALALAAGAAIGGALPRTRTEDEYLGEYSDHAKEAARETYERESEKARRVAGAVAEEARHIYDEKAEQARHAYDETAAEVDRRLRDAANESRSVTDRAKAEATDAAERLRNAATSEAQRQHLGDTKKPS